MIIIGLDPHPDTHTVAALNPNGRILASTTLNNTPKGLKELKSWAAQFPNRRWAVEGAGNRFLSSWMKELTATGEIIINIPPSLTSQYRSRRGKEKTDEIDAANAARVLLANPTLPTYQQGRHQRELQDLSRNRYRLAVQLKANRMALRSLAADSPARVGIELAITGLEAAMAELDVAIREKVNLVAPELLQRRGLGPTLCGMILAEVGFVLRFDSADSFASYCGAAPINRSSGRTQRVQVNPGGNRRLNYALHLLAIIRLRWDDRSKRLIERKVAEGKTKRQALRVLKTYLAREIYGLLVGIEKRRAVLGPIAA